MSQTVEPDARRELSGLPSVAVVTRTQLCEMPFVNEFLDYYTRLGASHFYFVNTEPWNRKQINSRIADPFTDRVTLVDTERDMPVRGCQNIVLPIIEEDYTLHVDMDEFAYPGGLTLPEFVVRHRAGADGATYQAFTLEWVMSPFYRHLYAPSIKSIIDEKYFFRSKSFKSMALTSVISRIGEHKFTFKEEISTRAFSVNHGNAFIFHVSARGILDVLNKCHCQQFDNAKKMADPVSGMRSLLFDDSSDFLPGRLISLAFQASFHDRRLTPDYEFPELTYRTDVDLLHSFTLEQLANLVGEDVGNEEIDRVRRKMKSVRIPRHLVDLYARKKINLLDAIAIIEKLRQSRYARLRHYLTYYRRYLASKCIGTVRSTAGRLRLRHRTRQRSWDCRPG